MVLRAANQNQPIAGGNRSFCWMALARGSATHNAFPMTLSLVPFLCGHKKGTLSLPY
jgi:hypothetical protein